MQAQEDAGLVFVWSFPNSSGPFPIKIILEAPCTTPFQKSPVPAATVDLLQSANTRVLALQRQLADKDAQLQAAQQSIRAQQGTQQSARATRVCNEEGQLKTGCAAGDRHS
eukprot:scaffold167391_cov21-Tisochrysis_lutea.AAC.2